MKHLHIILNERDLEHWMGLLVGGYVLENGQGQILEEYRTFEGRDIQIGVGNGFGVKGVLPVLADARLVHAIFIVILNHCRNSELILAS